HHEHKGHDHAGEGQGACCHHEHGTHDAHKKTPLVSPPPGAQVIYTCPMHPEVRQQGPGNCPICGMALEPETITGQEEENPELAYMRRRFWVGLVLTLPVLVLEMGAHLFDIHITGPRLSNWLQFA